jgi:hypothetical protein
VQPSAAPAPPLQLVHDIETHIVPSVGVPLPGIAQSQYDLDSAGRLIQLATG